MLACANSLSVYDHKQVVDESLSALPAQLERVWGDTLPLLRGGMAWPSEAQLVAANLECAVTVEEEKVGPAMPVACVRECVHWCRLCGRGELTRKLAPGEAASVLTRCVLCQLHAWRSFPRAYTAG